MLQGISSSHLSLLVVSIVIWVSGNGLIPLLPVYAAGLGADNAEIGMYLALSYTCLALGALSVSNLKNSFRGALFIVIVTGSLSVPCTLALGQITALDKLVLLTSFIWFLGGAGFSALNVLYTSLSQAERLDVRQRDSLMGLLAVTSPLGSVLGGALSGPLVDHWGFEYLFSVLAGLNILWPLFAGVLVIVHVKGRVAEDSVVTHQISGYSVKYQALFKRNHRKLIVATTLSYFSYYMGLLAISLLMKDAGYSATAISSTAVVGGLASLPLVFGVVRMSAYLGRKKAWLISNVAGALSLVCLFFASNLYVYWFVAGVMRCLSSGSRGISHSWIMDLVESSYHSSHHQCVQQKCNLDRELADRHSTPRQKAEARNQNQIRHQNLINNRRLNRAVALLSATPWVGGVLGYLSFGLISAWFSNDLAIGLAIALPALSVALVLSIKTRSSSSMRQAELYSTSQTNTTNAEVRYD